MTKLDGNKEPKAREYRSEKKNTHGSSKPKQPADKLFNSQKLSNMI